jgi:hypothetical protein
MRDLDPMDVKGASLLLTALFIAFSAWAELANHVWWSRLGMGLATAALAAWVTLAVIQVALRGENYKMYGLPAFYAIQSQIHILCFHTSSKLLRSGDRTDTLIDAFWHGPTTEVPQHMAELAGMLLERLNDVRPTPGVSLDPIYVNEIRNFCRILDNWWHTMEPMLATAGENARRRETVLSDTHL